MHNKEFSIARRWDMRLELEDAGYDNMSSAMRPMDISPSERIVYYTTVVLHGFVEFDLEAKDLSGGDYTMGSKTDPPTGKVNPDHPAARPGAGYPRPSSTSWTPPTTACR